MTILAQHIGYIDLSDDPVIQAAILYIKRKNGLHPRGYFDSTGRWFPDPIEVTDCCQTARRPSLEWKYSLLQHCRTIRHVACLFEVPKGQVNQALLSVKVARRLEQEELINRWERLSSVEKNRYDVLRALERA